LRNVDEKSDHFFGSAHHQNGTSGCCQKGMYPVLFVGIEGGGMIVPLIAKKILDM
jgi:hypothetical protein